MSDPLQHVQYLAGEIGPRGTGTPQESAAADYVAGQLTDLGISHSRSEFMAVPSQNTFPFAINMIALAAFVIYPLGGAVSRWVGAALALVTPFLLAQAIRTSSSILNPVLPKVKSQNILAWIEPQREARVRIVLLAHLDTNRCRLAWQSRMVRYIEPLTWLTLVVYAILGALYLAGALLGGSIWLWWLSLLPAGYILGSTWTLWRDERTPFSPGANDNAASVAVALQVAGHLKETPLVNSEVWLAFTGAEETDHAGLYDLLRSEPEAMRRAIFIGLEGVGGGEIVYLVKQGVCFHYSPDPGLLLLAERAAAKNPELGVKPASMLVEDEVGTLRRRGYQAICIAGRDPATGSLPHWHRLDDTPDTVSSDALETTVNYVIALLNELDAEVDSA